MGQTSGFKNVLRFEDGTSYKVDDAKSIAGWLNAAHSDKEVPFRPARILLQDFTGVPAVVDLAAMRDGIRRLGSDPQSTPFPFACSIKLAAATSGNYECRLSVARRHTHGHA